MENLERAVADEFGLEADPLEKHNRGMISVEERLDDYENSFDYYFQEVIDQKDIADGTKAHYARAYRDWTEFMEQYDRHSTLPSESHIDAFVDECLIRMNGDTCKKRLNHIKKAYEWMQRKHQFPHPNNYNPFLIIKNKREADLKGEDPDDYPNLDLDDIKEQVKAIKHVGERALTVFQLKTGVRSSELANIHLEDIHIANSDVLDYYDKMGMHDQLEDISNAVYIPPCDEVDENKREMPTLIPLDDETRRVLIDWLLIRPDNGDSHLFLTQKGGPVKRSSLGHIWKKHWQPQYKYDEGDELRTISPHYARHWMTTWFRTRAEMPELRVQYLRGDKTGPEVGRSRSAIHRYIHMHYEDIEEMYRNRIFKLGL